MPQGAETSAPRLTVFAALSSCPCFISGEAMAPPYTYTQTKLRALSEVLFSLKAASSRYLWICWSPTGCGALPLFALMMNDDSVCLHARRDCACLYSLWCTNLRSLVMFPNMLCVKECQPTLGCSLGSVGTSHPYNSQSCLGYHGSATSHHHGSSRSRSDDPPGGR